MRGTYTLSAIAVLVLLAASFATISAVLEKETDVDDDIFGDDGFGEGWTPISTTDELDQINADAASLAGNYYLVNDLEFDGSEGNFTPIGKSGAGFTGIFDGNGHVIKGLNVYITGSAEVSAGLFGYVYEGEIRNLGIEESSFTAISSASYAYAAAIAGYVKSSSGTTVIENCYSSASVYAKAGGRSASAGGILGISYGTVILDIQYGTVEISNCDNTGSIRAESPSGYGYAGGIVGYAQDADLSIEKCYNGGQIYASGGNMLFGGVAGGIAGYFVDNPSLRIEECYNTGSVEGSSDVSFWSASGGILGYVGTLDSDQSVIIENCYNAGEIKAKSSNRAAAGGITGWSSLSGSGSKITNCYNIGKVSSTLSQAGGISGYTEKGAINVTNCYYLEGQVYINGSVSADKLIGSISVSGTSILDGGSKADALTRDERVEQLSGIKNSTEMRPGHAVAKAGNSIYFTGDTGDTGSIKGWNFETIWMIIDDVNDGYPVLRALQAEPDTEYTITVTGGSADPTSGAMGTKVTLTADAPQAGKKFKEWNVISGGVTMSGNTFVIGTENVEIEAVYEDVIYTITVTDGSADPTSGIMGFEVTLTPGTPAAGKQFKEWNVTAGGVTIADNKFVIGTANVEISAVWED
ncbi:MAG: hypothetical protein LBE48_06430, partial [Methanomassiliicoccaceae archaeon]|nr:hypothetical protein [Methanomassiliicoccaceae archaeon]